MSTPLSKASALAPSLIVMLGLAAASCTQPDEAQPTSGGTVRAERAEAGALSLHPSIASDAGDGYVHEFY